MNEHETIKGQIQLTEKVMFSLHSTEEPAAAPWP